MEREVSMSGVRLFARFVSGSAHIVLDGGRVYWA
jgi:hypothetical protein